MNQILSQDSLTSLVDGFSDDVDDASKCSGSDWDGDGSAGVDAALSADETFGTVHGNRADGRLAQMLRHFQHQTRLAALHFEGVENRRQLAIKLDIDDGADHSDDLAGGSDGGRLGGSLMFDTVNKCVLLSLKD